MRRQVMSMAHTNSRRERFTPIKCPIYLYICADRLLIVPREPRWRRHLESLDWSSEHLLLYGLRFRLNVVWLRRGIDLTERMWSDQESHVLGRRLAWSCPTREFDFHDESSRSSPRETP